MKLFFVAAKPFRLLPVCLLPALVLALPVAADQEEVAVPLLETMMVTAIRMESSLKSHPGSATKLDSEELGLLRHTHVQQALARVPGVNLARGNGQEYLPALRSPVLTGAGACGSVLAAVDGIPLRPSGFCNINELFDAHTEMAAAIEVVRGPSTAFYGSNAMHGLINVITPSVSSESRYQLGVEGSSEDFTRLKFSTNQALNESHGLRVDMSGTHDTGYFDDSGYDQQKINIRHRFDGEGLSITSDLMASNLNQETAGYVVGLDAYRDPQLKTSNPNPEAFRDSRATRVSSRVEKQLSATSRLVLTPYARQSEMTFLQHFLPGTPLEANGQKSAGLQGAYYRDVSSQWQWAAGMDMEYTQGWLQQTQAEATQGSAFLQATIPAGKQYDYRVDAVMLALFGHSRWQLSDSVALTAGLRWEQLSYDYRNQMLDGRTDADGNACGFGGCRYSRPADSRDRFSNVSPKLGLLVDLSNQQQLYVSLAQGFRAPQATELYRLQREQQVAQLDSEELLSAEIGLRGAARGVTYELVVYQMQKDNVIFRDSDYFNVANGKTQHKGVELGIDASLSETLSLATSASYAEHRYDDDRGLGNNLIDSAPRFFANTRLSWRPRKGMDIELEWIKQGAYYTDVDGQHSYPGHSLFNLHNRWQLNEQLSLSAVVTNLTGRDYAERADYSSFSGDRYFPGKSRSLLLGMELSW